MVDISDTTLAKSDQLNADDLIGGSITVKITKVTKDKGKDQPIIINFEGDNGKPWKPSKGMRRVLIALWGKDSDNYIGKTITLFRNPDVKWAGQAVGGIQISHASNISSDMTFSLTIAKSVKKPYTVKTLGGESVKPKAVKKEEVVKDEKFEALKTAGYEAASISYDAFVTWGKSLSPDDRAIIQTELPAMKSKANGA
jgi:hypothetical protein